MKRCPECRRDYFDDSLLYCLDDGSALLEGPSSGGAAQSPPSGHQLDDEPRTAILHETAPPDEAPTRAQIHTTQQTAVMPPGIAEVPKRGLDKRLIVGPILLAVVVLGSFLGYRYIFPYGEQINSIAVLPFENRSGSADADYLSDGLADSLIYRLSQLPNLKVSPTSSVMRYKGKETAITQISQELEVDAVMSGRLVQRGDDLGVSVQLIDARTGKLIWAEQYDRKMTELLATQREIATAITQKLQLKLTGAESKGIDKKYTNNNEAYQAYLKGRYFWNRRTAENLTKAIEQFKAATTRDGDFALAYSGLADCYSVLPEYAGAPTGEALPQAKAYAERAIAIDDQLAEAHASLGLVNNKLWLWADAEQEFKRAIELDPNYASAYHWYSHLLRALGRYDEAAVMIQRGRDVDPLSSIINANVAEVYRLQNNHQAAIDTSLRIIELDPGFSYAYINLGLAYLDLGRKAEAVANLEKAVELSNRASFALMNLGYVYSVAGKRAEAAAIALELEERYAKKASPGAFIAGVYAGLGDKNKAFEWLEKDFQNKEELSFIRWRIHFEPLRDDPRFKDLLRRMNLPQ